MPFVIVTADEITGGIHSHATTPPPSDRIQPGEGGSRMKPIAVAQDPTPYVDQPRRNVPIGGAALVAVAGLSTKHGLLEPNLCAPLRLPT